MRYPDQMDRPLSDDDRRWLYENNFGDVADHFDREDGVGEYEEAESEPEPEKVSYSGMTMSELKAEIDDRNRELAEQDPPGEPLSKDGKKADLINRLKEDDAAIEAAAAGKPEE